MKFEQAARLKLRFSTPVGFITAEDLWDLPLAGGAVNLDWLAKSLNKEIKDAGEESFVYKSDKVDEVLQLSFDIVKHVIDVRLEEGKARKHAADVKAQKQKIMEAMAQLKDEKLKGESFESLQKMLDELSPDEG